MTSIKSHQVVKEKAPLQGAIRRNWTKLSLRFSLVGLDRCLPPRNTPCPPQQESCSLSWLWKRNEQTGPDPHSLLIKPYPLFALNHFTTPSAKALDPLSRFAQQSQASGRHSSKRIRPFKKNADPWRAPGPIWGKNTVLRRKRSSEKWSPTGRKPVAPAVRRNPPKLQSSFAKASEDTRLPPRSGGPGFLRRRVKHY